MNTQPTVTRYELSTAITLAFAALPGMQVLNRKRYGLNPEDASNDEAVTFRTLHMSNCYQAWESLDLLWRDATPDVRCLAIAYRPARPKMVIAAGHAPPKMLKEIPDELLVVMPIVKHARWTESQFKQLISGEAPAISRKGSPS